MDGGTALGVEDALFIWSSGNVVFCVPSSLLMFNEVFTVSWDEAGMAAVVQSVPNISYNELSIHFTQCKSSIWNLLITHYCECGC